jgi:hypothetical protein
MTTRSQRSAKERDTRSRAVKRLSQEDLLRGSLVEMLRTCGKSGCRCQQGDKHRALYLSIKSGGKRSMVYIPQDLEQTVREWVENAKELDQLLHLISEHCFQQFLRQKEQTIRSKRSASRKAKRKGKSP